MSQALYAQWPDDSRRSWGWAAIVVVLVTYVISAAPLVIVGVVVGAIAAVGGASPEQGELTVASLDMQILAPTLMAQFALWAGLVWLWAFAFERRGWASLGFAGGFGGCLRYGAGLVVGVALFGLIVLLAGMFLAGDPLEGAAVASSPERLASPAVLAMLAFVVCVFLVQGGAEEIVFRGWLMSTLASRWGVRAAVIASSAVFMVFHAHVFISGVVFGFAALAGIGMLGLVFALLSLATRSVVEAIAAHGVFNAAAVVIPTAALLVQDSEMSVIAALDQVFAIATGTAGADSLSVGPQLLAQSLGGAIICTALVLVVVRRKPARPWKEAAR